MRRRRRTRDAVGLLGGMALLGAAACGQAADAGGADMVLRGGTVYTVDEANPWAEAVALKDGRIVYVGDDEGASALVGRSTEVVELDGRMVLPGLHDSHVHPVSGGVELGECDLNEAASREEVVQVVADCARRDSDAPWVRGGGFQLPLFPGGSPTRELLDSLVPDRPAYLSSADGHSAWVNSRALELAGVTAATPDPLPDGVIVRRADGSPAGTLRESAMGLVGRLLPERTDAEVLAGLKRALSLAAGFGITTLHEASAGEDFLKAYAAAAAEGTLTARVFASLQVSPDEGVEQVARLAALRDRYESDLVRPVEAKIFADGVIEGQTAALLADYLDRPGFRGELNFPPDAMAALVATLDAAGFKVHVHAIGDRAIRVTFDAFERQHQRDGGAGPRHIMAHIQLFDPEDIGRFAELGLVASFQPLWAFADTYITDLTEPRLGPERSRWMYPIKSVLDSGATVAGGSDWSVSTMNPFPAMEVAVTRRDPEAEAGPAWIPEERVDLADIVQAYTLGGAMAGDMEAETGTLTVGKNADLIVVDRDIFAIPAQQISETRVDLTVFQGRVVFRR
ncbi:MAG TPA: amidohydrolase [Longimicrobiales bacterium]|nr:amidohydrolase [Longimicrobiales bacterium]